jgi:hypothetical protein
LQHKTKKPNPYQTLSDSQKIVPDIVGACKSYHSWVLDDIVVKYIVASSLEFDFDNDSLVDAVVNQMPKQYRTFMGTFMKGQIFRCYADKLRGILCFFKYVYFCLDIVKKPSVPQHLNKRLNKQRTLSTSALSLSVNDEK